MSHCAAQCSPTPRLLRFFTRCPRGARARCRVSQLLAASSQQILAQLMLAHAHLERGVGAEGLLQTLHGLVEDGIVVVGEVGCDLIETIRGHVEENAIRVGYGGGGAAPRREHRELAEIGAGHQSAEGDRLISVGYIYVAVLYEEHRIARLVHHESVVTLEQDLVRREGVKQG